MGAAEKLERGQSTLAIKCHWCGHNGLSVWEETPNGRELVSIDGFYERLKSLRPYKIETVCDNCNRVQPI
jgi:hypothetical protein